MFMNTKVYDRDAAINYAKKPNLPKGACAQAWSVAEVLRIILER